MRHTDPSSTSHTPEQAAETPFVIMLHQRDRKPSGSFRPEAEVVLGRALRTSGLLLALPPEEMQTLLLILTFVTPNGWCRPSVPLLAGSLPGGEAKAQARLRRLQAFRWLGRPIVSEAEQAGGLGVFTLSPAVASLQNAPEPAPEAALPLPPSSRGAILAHSRAMYAHPRAEVERGIAERMGWKELGDGPEARLRLRLLGVAGLLREQVDLLIEQYPHERIGRQLDWLPHRRAKSPARFLMAAVENDYDPPPTLRPRLAHGVVSELGEARGQEWDLGDAVDRLEGLEPDAPEPQQPKTADGHEY